MQATNHSVLEGFLDTILTNSLAVTLTNAVIETYISTMTTRVALVVR